MDVSLGRAFMLGVLFIAGGLVAVWLYQPVFGGRESARAYVGSHRLAVSAVVVVFLLNALLGIPFAPLLGDGRGIRLETFLVAAATTQVPMLFVLFTRLVLPGALSWQDLGLRPLPLGSILRVGLVTGLAGLALTIAVGLALLPFGVRQNQLEQYSFLRDVPFWQFVLVFITGSVFAPFVEELFFRGFIFGTLRRQHRLPIAYVSSGLLFSLLHVNPQSMNGLQSLGLVAAVIGLGTLLAWTYQRQASLFPSMIAHAVNNAVVLTALYATGTA